MVVVVNGLNPSAELVGSRTLRWGGIVVSRKLCVWMCEWREGEAERLSLYLGIGNEARFDPRQLRTRDHDQSHYGIKQPFTPLWWDHGCIVRAFGTGSR